LEGIEIMKKITILTAVGFAVLLMLSVMPASAIREVSSFESAGPIVNATDVFNNSPSRSVNFTANQLPMFYIDLDSVDFDPLTQGESINITLSAADQIAKDGFVYMSTSWKDINQRVNIAWLGEKYLAVGDDVTKLSKYLVDFESDESITLRQGDSWDIGEGFTLVVQDIDINGEQVWLALEKDGSPIEDIIANPKTDGGWGYYNDTLAGESDVVIAKIHVDKVFAGMSANMAIIDDAEVISLDVLELDADTYFGMDFSEGIDASNFDYIQLQETDSSISISKGKTKEIIKDFLSIRVGDTKTGEPVRFYVYQEVSTPGIYEQHGPIVNATDVFNNSPSKSVNFTANDVPMFYLDLDAVDFNPLTQGENLNITLSADDQIAKDGFVYSSTSWKDINQRVNIAWLGEKYLAVGGDVTKLSKYLVDFESDESITLRQGDSWDIGEGFTLVVQDIDINGEQVWLALEKDGSPIEDIIANPKTDGGWGYYNDTLAGESDVVIAKIHVDKVFAGMSANMAIIDDAEVISMDVLELDADTYFGMDFSEGTDAANFDYIQLQETDSSISISKGKTKEIINDFLSIRVGDTKTGEPVRFYVYNEVQVGEGVTPVKTVKPTATATGNATATATGNATATATGATATATGNATTVVTTKPTKQPGFEAVFAIAGLLAVAYLVLRKRE
jgi:S-layer protein (TIGR01567 family)